MEPRELMTGIAVVIDDAIFSKCDAGSNEEASGDSIGQIVRWFENEWSMPFCKSNALPNEKSWSNLLGAASFVLLDWKLWHQHASEAIVESTIAEIIKFLVSARENLVPVFILTNEFIGDVTKELSKLSDDIYDEDAPDSNFVFVESKANFWNGQLVDTCKLQNWINKNPSIYALKAWNGAFGEARKELFDSMYKRSADWPCEFWRNYEEDGVEPSASLTALINDSLFGRMRSDAFEGSHFQANIGNVRSAELRQLIAEASFRKNDLLSGNEVRCGDIFRTKSKEFWFNLRPDCDCIPRQDQRIGDIEVHCVKGDLVKHDKLVTDIKSRKRQFSNGQFMERITESLVFGVVDGDSILFRFDKLKVKKYSEISGHRFGRLLHPYLTRVQQRYALFIQRQALPRIPDRAVDPTK